MKTIELDIPSLSFTAYKVANTVIWKRVRQGASPLKSVLFIVLMLFFGCITGALLSYALSFLSQPYLPTQSQWIFILSIFIIYIAVLIFQRRCLLKKAYDKQTICNTGFQLSINDDSILVHTTFSKTQYAYPAIKGYYFWNKAIHFIILDGLSYLWIPEDVISGHKDEEAIRQFLKIAASISDKTT